MRVPIRNHILVNQTALKQIILLFHPPHLPLGSGLQVGVVLVLGRGVPARRRGRVVDVNNSRGAQHPNNAYKPPKSKIMTIVGEI